MHGRTNCRERMLREGSRVIRDRNTSNRVHGARTVFYFTHDESRIAHDASRAQVQPVPQDNDAGSRFYVHFGRAHEAHSLV